MKTILLATLTAVFFQTMSAQNELASATSVLPFVSRAILDEGYSAEPSIAAQAYTVDGIATISLGRGLRKNAELQVLTPGTQVLLQKEIPAGQTQIRVDLNGLPDGTYTLRLGLGTFTWVKQIVKE